MLGISRFERLREAVETPDFQLQTACDHTHRLSLTPCFVGAAPLKAAAGPGF